MAVITYVEGVDEFRGIAVNDRVVLTKREEGTNLVFVRFLTGACKGEEYGMDIRQISSEED